MEHHTILVLAGIVVLGIGCQWLAWRLKIPAILPLLITGFLVGPVLHWLHPRELLGELFFPSISLSVAIILFEGALTLEFREIRRLRGVVRNLITVGALVTLVGGALAARLLIGLPWLISFLFGALIVVTGPTVIGPLLRNIRPTQRVASILKWEGILIDPIGALLAVIIFDIIIAEGPLGNPSLIAISTFARIMIIGLVLGLLSGYITAFFIKRYWVPDYLNELFALAMVIGVFALSDVLQSESGLLAVTVMGVVLANSGLHQLHDMWHFKERISILLISTLFIILAANVSFEQLSLLGVNSLLLLGVVLFVLRPLSIWVSTLNSDLSRNERLFLSWVAPRGIVAASVSSLFAFRLEELGYAEAAILAPLTFLVIVGTVFLHGSTAKWVAQRLGVAEADPQGFLMMGATEFARALAKLLKENGFNVLLVDTNRHNVRAARIEGLEAHQGNLLSESVQEDLSLSGLGHFLALTSNDEANALACVHMRDTFGARKVYQLPPREENGQEFASGLMGRILFDERATYETLESLMQRGGVIKATLLTEKFTCDEYRQVWGDYALPLLAFRGKKVIVATTDEPFQPEPGWKLVALVLETEARRAGINAPETLS
ncbi:MAG: sodium:proton antiporter [Ardenticatenia bacterium]|nr:MAG: sodium:proton antiporter [Ardenticatenia bacterium]